MTEPATQRSYTQRFNLHMRLDKGGYVYGYEILCDGEVIGSKTVTRATRSAPLDTVYTLGEAAFEKAADLIAAHEGSQ